MFLCSAPDFILNRKESIGINNGLMAVFHTVLRQLTAIRYIPLGQMICPAGFLQEQIPSVGIITKYR